MNVIDASRIDSAYENGAFSLDRWKEYIRKAFPPAEALCLDDLEECLKAGLSWENDYLPMLDSAYENAEVRAHALASFQILTENLNDRIRCVFGRELDADLVLYLGLGSGAGWVTELGGRTTVLFGIEKIVELGWEGEKAMTGLIYHELGHVYQRQYGVLEREFSENADSFLWQLFTEGVAMVFEQMIAGGKDYFHQYDDEWKTWCDANLRRIANDFNSELDTMTLATQRWFGDWVEYDGHGDTGYFLGARFVQRIMKTHPFDELINFDIDEVKARFKAFLNDLNEE